MERKSITTSRAGVSCGVCGRTLLRGEHADAFIAHGSRRMVCELCTARATNEGWIREGADNATTVHRHGSRVPRSLLGRLKRPRGEAPEQVPADQPYRRISANVSRIEPASARADDAWHEEPPVAPPPAGPPEPEPAPVAREERHVHAVPTNADLKRARALDVFNVGPHPRRVAGVARSLGMPIVVSVVPSEIEGAIVTIVVGWELCWYRYEVDLADEAAGVRVLGQGAELSELSEAELVANGVADERGRLFLAA